MLTDEQLNPEEVEARLEKVALTGLQNIYHAITGKDCPRHLALGMATSAVSALKAQQEKLVEAMLNLRMGGPSVWSCWCIENPDLTKEKEWKHTEECRAARAALSQVKGEK